MYQTKMTNRWAISTYNYPGILIILKFIPIEFSNSQTKPVWLVSSLYCLGCWRDIGFPHFNKLFLVWEESRIGWKLPSHWEPANKQLIQSSQEHIYSSPNPRMKPISRYIINLIFLNFCRFRHNFLWFFFSFTYAAFSSISKRPLKIQ